MNRTDTSWIRTRLQLAQGWSQKSLGQHFLVDQSVVTKAITASGLQPGESVIEIGPGMGVLSEALLEAGAVVTAFELDPVMQKILAEDLPDLTVVPGDALQQIPLNLPKEGYRVIANIPYQITTPLLELFLQDKRLEESRPLSLTLLIQKEVAERLAAPADTSNRSFLSVLAQYFCAVEIIGIVPPRSFWPEPAVDSAVINLVLHPSRRYSGEQEQRFFKFVRALFVQRRKQLKNVFAGIRGISSEEVATLFATLNLPITARAQELSHEQWYDLFESGA